MSADQKTPQGAPKSDSSVRANRLRHCGELMQEVEKCHAQGLFHRMAGVCNFEASLLADCMHEERVLRTRRQVEQSRKTSEALMKDVYALRQEEEAARKAMRLRKEREQQKEQAEKTTSTGSSSEPSFTISP